MTVTVWVPYPATLKEVLKLIVECLLIPFYKGHKIGGRLLLAVIWEAWLNAAF